MFKQEETARRVLIYRTLNKITQRNMAKILGISEVTLNSLENQKYKTKNTTLVEINLKLDELEKTNENN